MRTGLDCESLKQAVHDHLRYSMARLPRLATPRDYYRALALAVRDPHVQRWTRCDTDLF